MPPTPVLLPPPFLFLSSSRAHKDRWTHKLSLASGAPFLRPRGVAPCLLPPSFVSTSFRPTPPPRISQAVLLVFFKLLHLNIKKKNNIKLRGEGGITWCCLYRDYYFFLSHTEKKRMWKEWLISTCSWRRLDEGDSAGFTSVFPRDAICKQKAFFNAFLDKNYSRATSFRMESSSELSLLSIMDSLGL